MKTKVMAILLAAATLAGMADDAVATPSAKAGQPGTRAVGDRWNRDNIGVVVTNSPGSDMDTRYRNAHYATSSMNVTAAEFAPTDAANTIYFGNTDEPAGFWAYAPYQPSATPDDMKRISDISIGDCVRAARLISTQGCTHSTPPHGQPTGTSTDTCTP